MGGAARATPGAGRQPSPSRLPYPPRQYSSGATSWPLVSTSCTRPTMISWSPPRSAVFDRALERGQHAVEPWAARPARAMPHVLPESHAAAAGEVGREVPLRFGEDVDHEGAVRANRLQRDARPVEADQQQRRVKRERRDRVRGRADRLPVRAERGDDRDAGSEVPDCIPELGRGDLGRNGRGRELGLGHHPRSLPRQLMPGLPQCRGATVT